MWGESDAQWKNVVNPTTGGSFGSYGDYSTWAKGMESQGKAAASGFNTAAPATTKDEPSWDWTKTNWAEADPQNPGGYVMGNGQGYGLTLQTVPVDTVGSDGTPIHYDAGDYRYTAPGTDGNDAGGSGKYSGWGDYGLGKGYEGIMPVGRTNLGAPEKFLVFTQGGGALEFANIEEAKTAAQGYRNWYAEAHNLDPVTMQDVGTSAGKAKNAPATSTTTGELMTPGANEKFYDSTKDFYTSPTEAHKKWDETANQPTKMEQNWNSFNGQFNQPSQAEGQWASQKEFYGNPGQLDNFYKRQEEKARGALSARASAAGIGDSSTAARATANLGLDYSDRLLAARENFDKTGMGLAQGADSGFYQRATGAKDLAGATDKSVNDKLAMGIAVDQGDLARISSGAVAAGSAQNAKEKRLTGGLDSATSLAKDIADMTAGGLSPAEATKLAPLLSALEVQFKQGALTADQAYKQASETAATMGISTNAVLQYMIASKFAGGSTTSGASGGISIPGNVSMPVST